MKNTILSLSFIFACFIASAQDKKVDVRLGYGVVTVPQVIEGISTMLASGLIPGGYSSVDLSGSGAFFGSVLLMPEKRFSMGLDIGFEKTRATYKYTNGSSSVLKNSWNTFMVRGDYKYLDSKNFKMYGTASAGVVALRSKAGSDKQSDVNFAFQLTPIGMRVGNNIALWTEGGFGFKGLLSGGISMKL